MPATLAKLMSPGNRYGIVLVVALLLTGICYGSDLAKKKLQLRKLQVQLRVMKQQTRVACKLPDSGQHPGVMKTIVSMTEVDKMIAQLKTEFETVLKSYLNCTQTTTMPPTSTVKTVAATAAPTPQTFWTGNASFDDTAFIVTRMTNWTADDGLNFLFLQVELPVDGLSKSSDWCRDYQRLCSHFGRRPVGCHQSFYYNYKVENCYLKYTSAKEVRTLGCAPNWRLANLTAQAFPDLPYSSALPFKSMAFYECSERCTKNAAGSGTGVTNIHYVFHNYNRIGYSVCY